MLLRNPGWRMRASILILLLWLSAILGGSFHDLVLWTTSFVFVLAYSQQWDRKRVAVVLLAGSLCVFLLLSIKQEYRAQIWYGQTSIAESRIGAFSKLIFNTMSEPSTLFSEDKLPETLVRLNQGWIVNRAMIRTPSEIPFARGKTIVNSVAGALLPRFISPHKKAVGGQKDYERYTGLILHGASMELGYAGEMYVNFGIKWGVLAVGLYGLVLGLGFRWLFVRALRQPLWWAWVPYFAIVAIKAETSVGYMVNWLLKAAIVMVGVMWLCPAMKQVLWGSTRNTKPSSKLNS